MTVADGADVPGYWTLTPSLDTSLGTILLLFVLSVIAGSVGVISFLSLGGLFAAHITDDLVILAAHLVDGATAPMAPYEIIRSRTLRNGQLPTEDQFRAKPAMSSSADSIIGSVAGIGSELSELSGLHLFELFPARKTELVQKVNRSLIRHVAQFDEGLVRLQVSIQDLPNNVIRTAHNWLRG
jgi:hypothetical protein